MNSRFCLLAVSLILMVGVMPITPQEAKDSVYSGSNMGIDTMHQELAGSTVYSVDVLPAIRHYLPSQQAIDEYRNSSDFDYSQDSYQKSWMAYVLKLLRRVFSFLGGGEAVLGYSLVFLGVIAFAWLLISITRGKSHFLFFNSGSNVLPFAVNADINVADADLDSMEELYVKHGAYREAIRVKYLILLRILNENNLIHWNQHKTNSDYVAEMAGNANYQLFKDLTGYYDYCWYGHFTPDAAMFQMLSAKFDSFKNLFRK
jgi:hypothetical protein